MASTLSYAVTVNLTTNARKVSLDVIDLIEDLSGLYQYDDEYFVTVYELTEDGFDKPAISCFFVHNDESVANVTSALYLALYGHEQDVVMDDDEYDARADYREREDTIRRGNYSPK